MFYYWLWNWKQLLFFRILTCVSFNCNALAISIRRALVKYLLKWNSFSNSVNCLFVKFVRAELLLLFNSIELFTADGGSPVNEIKWWALIKCLPCSGDWNTYFVNTISGDSHWILQKIMWKLSFFKEFESKRSISFRSNIKFAWIR